MRLKRCFPLIKTLTAILLGVQLLTAGASPVMEEENLIAALSLNIVRFTHWPDQQSNTFTFCVYGDNVTKEAFSSLEGKAVNSRTIQIKSLSHLVDLDQCQALYLSDLKVNFLTQVFNELKHKPVLTLGASDNFADNGGMIGLRKQDGKLKIDINLHAVTDAKVVISSRLLSLANIIESVSP